MDPVADHLEHVAARLTACAGAVRTVGEQLHVRSAQALWSAAAAEQFRTVVAYRRARCVSVADELSAAGGRLRQLAEGLR
ncbi:MAG: hypothetical protein NVSMB13_20930 [Mycobacteriales bacterium]